MERVGILINKLQEQFEQQTDINKLIVTTQMLYTELLQQKETVNGHQTSFVAITSPNTPPVVQIKADAVVSSPVVEVKEEWIQEITPIEIKEQFQEPIIEIETVKQNEAIKVIDDSKPGEIKVLEDVHPFEEKKDVAAAFVYDMPLKEHEPASWAFNPIEVPTLAHQQKVVYELKDSLIDDGTSLNDKLKEEKVELGNMLHETPIRDLKKAISINDRHRFIESLFRGDETMYERSIKTINNFTIIAEAEFWIQRELKLKLGWDTNLPEVKVFDQLVKRRFS